jgi:nicotinate-nucleotide pyrophosphorylase (carboxylating)
MLNKEMKKKLVSLLKEDIGRGDVTSAVIPLRPCRAKIIAKEPGIVAGLEEAKFLFRQKNVKAKALVKDGGRVRKGATILKLSGKNKNIFSVERTALNVLGRMSEVASTCAEAKNIAGKQVTLALTRKTMPGFNIFDKKAASIGGVWPHRINLNSFVLLKENHLHFFDSPFDAVVAARKRHGRKMKVEIEIETILEAFNAARAKPDVIMLDNFSSKKALASVKALRKAFSGQIELSGGITKRNLRTFARAKPDIISMGSLTYSTKWRDFSLLTEK